MCRRASEPSTGLCPCGHDFGLSTEDVVLLLRDQLAVARILVALLVVADLVALLGMTYLVLHGIAAASIFVVAALIAATVRQIRKLGIARGGLREIAAREPVLPTAVARPR